MADAQTPDPPRFCGQCGSPLPPNDPRFCIGCGAALRPDEPPVASRPTVRLSDPPAAHANSGPTVRLANAPGAQAVVGGTIRLPTAEAVPPGMWLLRQPPGPDDVVAVYAPLRAVVGGWSGLTQHGWEKLGHAPVDGSSRQMVSFAVEREWFPARGYGAGLRLAVRVGAQSYAEEGHTRQGFRYRISADPPMEVLDAWWLDEAGRPRRDLPVPQIQLMAPPRAWRISDYDEQIKRLNAREANSWARAGAVTGVFRMLSAKQQRTPIGRGLALAELPGGGLLLPLIARMHQQLYRVQIRRPLVCNDREWRAIRERMRGEARSVGLDMDSDAVAEWWIDREGYDGALLSQDAYPGQRGRVAVVLRRIQIAEILSE